MELCPAERAGYPVDGLKVLCRSHRTVSGREHSGGRGRPPAAGLKPSEGSSHVELTSLNVIVPAQGAPDGRQQESNEKQPGEKPEGKFHYNPGNQSGKVAENVPVKEAEKDGKPA